MADAGWTWIDPPPPPSSGEDERLKLARTFARLFAGAEGEAALAHLTALTTERCLGPEASDAALRMLEGQRQLVRHILSLIDRGHRGR